MAEAETVIKFDHVVKRYKLFKNDRERFKSLFTKKAKYKEKLATNDLSFEIKRGEGVAFMGRNGAGKSTILKMITGVCYPTSGEITVKGRVSALLELSAGFNPQFTGRENIYLKCNIMGMNNDEIKAIENDIVEFAELGEYIDQPVRTYSSGMNPKMRPSATPAINSIGIRRCTVLDSRNIIAKPWLESQMLRQMFTNTFFLSGFWNFKELTPVPSVFRRQNPIILL